MIPRQSSLPVIVLLLAGLVLTVAAGLMMFSTFMLYDDEGYVLFSLKNFAEHGHLYDTVYTQYGPLPYVFYAALHAVGLPLTHVAGRLLTLAAWAGAAGFSTALVWRATRHFGAALATLAAVFVYLWIMVSEPNHPGALIAVLTAALGALGYGWLAADKTTRWAALAGAGAAALILTKINVGVFAALSVLAFFLLHAAAVPLRRIAPWLIAAGLAVLPFALMRALLGTPWVQTYALVFALAAVPAAGAAALAAATEPRLRLGWREFRAAIFGGIAVSVVVLGVVLARGTTLAEIIEGTLLGPLRHPTHFSLVFPWPAGTTVGAAVSFGLFGVALALRSHERWAPVILRTVVTLRFIAAAALAYAILRFPLTSPDNAVFAHGLPLLWVFLWPLPGENHPAARTWLGLLLLGQWLHPYPVPGSQIAWGTFLALPLVVLGCACGVIGLKPRQPAAPGQIRLTSQLILILLALVTGSRLLQIGTRYLDSRPLGLPGAASLRLPDSTTATYRLLSLNAAAHADVLFSLPGMFSFNLWTGLPAPTLANVTHWFSLLDDAQQQEIIRVLAAHPRSAVIVQAGHLDFLRQRGLTPGGPLYDYVMREYTPAFTIDGFEFRVRRGRRIAPLLTAEVRERPAASNPSDPFNTLVEIPLLLSPGQKIAAVEFAAMDSASAAPLRLDATNARLESTPITLQGDPASVATGATLLRVYFNRGDQRFSLARTLIVVRDAAGSELGLARVRP